MSPDDEREFGDYVVARSTRLCEFAYLLCGDWHSAQDAVQTALARLYVVWGRLHSRESLDPYVRRIVVESGGDFASVTDDEIREARGLVESLEGISPCFSASTAVAALIKQVRRGSLDRHDTVLVNLTGGDRPRTSPGQSVRWLRREQNRWVEEQPREVQAIAD